ncbi:MAG: cation-translocating P-type ATPase [Candidatus Binatia bacterium]|nr:cation-translocating P-type ATPase [Candidatus Binatia bacterium]
MPSSSTNISLSHSLAGRTRFRISAIKQNSEAAERLAAWIATTDAVHAAQASAVTGSLLVTYDPAKLTPTQLVQQIQSALADGLSFTLSQHPPPAHTHESSDQSSLWRFLGLTAVMGTVFIREVIFKVPVAQSALSPLGLLAAVASVPLLSRSLERFREEGRLSLESFLGGTTLAAVAVGEAATALEVLWIHSGAAWLIAWITERSRRAIAEIVQLSDQHAVKLVDGREVDVPTEALKPGDLIVVHPDERIPVDGRVEGGEALVDESPITGRADFAVRQSGDTVFAGTILRQGTLQIRAEQVGNSTYLARIFQMVEDSLVNKAPIEEVADRLARTLVNLGFVATAGTLLVTGSLWNAFTVMLVMACPCATALAASTAISAAMNTAARRYILIKGGRYLEEIGKAEIVCFDKTGTLTTGHASVARIVALHNTPELQLLEWAASAEAHNRHPFALALCAEARTQGLPPAHLDVVEPLLGMGVRAAHDGHEFLLGNQKLMERFGIRTATDTDSQPRPADHTIVYLAKDGELVGFFELTQQIRPETRTVVEQLRRAGVHQVVMITGDEEPVATALAERLGVTLCFASVTPEEKAAIVTKLRHNGRKVVMVGDGINDALALAEADVGVAMGAGGSPVAIEAADIALVRDDLRDLLYAHTLSQDTLRVVSQNFWIATGSNILGVVLGATGQLSPMAAGLIHIVHTLGVLANSSRLLRHSPDT